MRDILFRGIGLNGEGWVYGGVLYSKNMGEAFIFEEFAESIPGEEDVGGFTLGCDTIYVDPKTVSQYTGLKDKNDVMIFEGDCFDVVLSSVPPGSEKLYLNSKQYTTKGVVKKATSGMWVISYTDPMHKQDVNQTLIYFIENNKEIIGNIHDKNN